MCENIQQIIHFFEIVSIAFMFQGARAMAMYAKIAQRNGLLPIIGKISSEKELSLYL